MLNVLQFYSGSAVWLVEMFGLTVQSLSLSPTCFDIKSKTAEKSEPSDCMLWSLFGAHKKGSYYVKMGQ